MGAFEYTALDSGGRERKGILEGDGARQVRQLLREKQLLPVTVTEVAQKEAKHQRSFSFGGRVSAADLSLFTRQLATLVRAGLPLEESLLAVSQQTEKPRMQSIVLGVRSKVMEGHTLADSLNEYPNSFPELYRATVAASERRCASAIKAATWGSASASVGGGNGESESSWASVTVWSDSTISRRWTAIHWSSVPRRSGSISTADRCRR